MEHTENSKTQITYEYMLIFCVKLTHIYEIYKNLLDEEASWSKSQIKKTHLHINFYGLCLHHVPGSWLYRC